MKKKENYLCAFEYAIDCINGKWKGKILKYLNERTYRFNELHKRISGITQKMLSQMLKELEKDGIVKRKSFNTIPPKVEYSLSEEGKELEKIFYLLGQWGEKLAKKNDLENVKCADAITF
jgi:DNA-binding HxlR family transcriptional regulator